MKDPEYFLNYEGEQSESESPDDPRLSSNEVIKFVMSSKLR
jgi:hypothetical protein